jgi:hypothetical protein
VKFKIALVLAALLLSACISKDVRDLRQGLIELNFKQQTFLDEWGPPDHTSVTSGDEIMQAGISAYSGFFFKGRQTYEVWDYKSRKTSLVFFRKKIAAWKTDASTQELAKPKD